MNTVEHPADGRVVVIGVGNPFRGDDGVGHRVAQLVEDEVRSIALASAPSPDGHARVGRIEVVLSDGEASRLVDEWRGADRAVVIDAVITGSEPGCVRVWEAGRQPLPCRTATSTHASGVAEAWALGEALGTLPGRLVVVGVEGARFGDGTTLSPPVERALPSALRLAMAAIATDGPFDPTGESGSFDSDADAARTASSEP